MNLQSQLTESYQSLRDGIERDYENLMRQEREHSAARMDAYATLRTQALSRLQAVYGMPDAETPAALVSPQSLGVNHAA